MKDKDLLVVLPAYNEGKVIARNWLTKEEDEAWKDL